MLFSNTFSRTSLYYAQIELFLIIFGTIHPNESTETNKFWSKTNNSWQSFISWDFKIFFQKDTIVIFICHNLLGLEQGPDIYLAFHFLFLLFHFAVCLRVDIDFFVYILRSFGKLAIISFHNLWPILTPINHYFYSLTIRTRTSDSFPAVFLCIVGLQYILWVSNSRSAFYSLCVPEISFVTDCIDKRPFCFYFRAIRCFRVPAMVFSAFFFRPTFL